MTGFKDLSDGLMAGRELIRRVRRKFPLARFDDADEITIPVEWIRQLSIALDEPEVEGRFCRCGHHGY